MARETIDRSEIITTAEAAEIAGVKPVTWRGLVSRRGAPRPLHPGSGLYVRSEVVEWVAQRPGSGRWGPR